MTPLTAIRGYLETLGMPGVVRDEATRERYVRIVTEETLRLEAIIGDLLDLARLEGGGGEIEAADVPVSWLFERVAERHGVVTSQRGITLTTTIEPGAEHVRGDGRRLEQALQNLVANAVRHTPDGGRVAVTASPRGRRRAVARRRHGPGHPARAPAAGVRPLLQDRSGAAPARPAAGWVSPSSRPSSNGTAAEWRRRRLPAAAHDSTSFCRRHEVKPRACPTRSRPCSSPPPPRPWRPRPWLPRC